jgi:single-strand DNA-binding protein
MNKVIIIGRLVADPEARTSASGTISATFTVATDRFLGKDKEKEADFIRCVAWGKTAEHISKFFNKGKQIALEGNIKTGSYEKDGIKHYTTDVWVDKVEFVGSNNNSQTAPQQTPASVEEVTTDDLPF